MSLEARETNDTTLDLETVRQRLSEKGGREYWRSLEEVAETEEFQKWIDDEFPNRASLIGIDRRDFLKYMGASVLLAGLGGCRFLPQERVIPYIKAPEDRTFGIPSYFATAAVFGGYATGLLAKSFEGRPIKLEGNPDHPASMGAIDIFSQCSLLNLYDPDRSQNAIHEDMITTWEEFFKAVRPTIEGHRKTGGVGLRILSETTTSPSFGDQIAGLLKQFPSAQWHQFEPTSRDNVKAAAVSAFGAPLNPVYHFEKAKVIFSLDSDFLTAMPGSLRYARDFATGRTIEHQGASMNRLYALDCVPSVTAANADHRLPVKASEVEGIARAVAARLGVSAPGEPSKAIPERWLSALVADLTASRGASIVLAGDHMPAAVHTLAHAMNAALGNIGSAVTFTDPVEVKPTIHIDSFKKLVADMQAGQVETLLVLGSNPAYNAPADVDFANAVKRVKLAIHMGAYNDETGALCHWHLPEAHFLEAWGDARAYDGTASIIQPLIAPLFSGRSYAEMLSELFDKPKHGYDIVRDYWRGHGIDDNAWQEVLNGGLVPNSALPQKAPTPNIAAYSPSAVSPGLEVNFRPDPTVWDGRFANNGWLQECPKPLTTVTWQNTVQISPATASRLGLTKGDHVELSAQGRKVEGAVFVVPGQADDVLGLHLGYGRTRGGQVAGIAGKMDSRVALTVVGEDVGGFDAYRLQSSTAPWFFGGVQVHKTGGRDNIAAAQTHNSMEGRDILRMGTLAEYAKNPSLKPEGHEAPESSLYPEKVWDTEGHYQWAMTIDLSLCIGCNACVMACVAENNIPVVGKTQVLNGREMHWIRVDRYYKVSQNHESKDITDLDNDNASRIKDAFDPARIESAFQPVPCMHCENAPCEPVCPVAATVHSHEGLNQMVYNRCVGTRYCSNNCPYKVRRFNFLNYTDNQTQFSGTDNGMIQDRRRLLKMVNNPDVTVRGRGVMEKCTYCVQRINHARIEAKKEGRRLGDGEVVTACQQACPTHAIVFGDLTDANSQVNGKRKNDRSYGLLTDLNTKPRTTYMGRLTNPNPELEKI